MSKQKAVAPTPIDVEKTAGAQTKSNVDTAVAQTNLNNVNQVTPYGSISYEQIGTNPDGTPKYQATTALSADQQGLLDQQTGLASGRNAVAQSLLDSSSGVLGNTVDLSRENIGNYIDTHYLDDFNQNWDRQGQSLETQLANRGLKMGSSAYTNALDDLAKRRASAQDNLYSNLYGNAQNAILTERNQPISEMSALMSGGGSTNPNPAQTTQTGIEGTDIAGLTNANYNQQYQNYQNTVNQNNATLGGLFNLGSAALGGWALSDRRAKKDVKQVGKLPNDVNVYEFAYRKGMGRGPLAQLGLMAQDVERKIPQAVATGADGLKRVDYGRAVRAA